MFLIFGMCPDVPSGEKTLQMGRSWRILLLMPRAEWSITMAFCLRAGEGSDEGLGVPEKASKIWRCRCSSSVEITKSYLVIMVLTLFFLYPPKRAFWGGWRGAILALPKTCPFSGFILFFSERVISSCCPFLFPEILPGLDEQGTHCWDVWYFHH